MGELNCYTRYTLLIPPPKRKREVRINLKVPLLGQKKNRHSNLMAVRKPTHTGNCSTGEDSYGHWTADSMGLAFFFNWINSNSPMTGWTRCRILLKGKEPVISVARQGG